MLVLTTSLIEDLTDVAPNQTNDGVQVQYSFCRLCTVTRELATRVFFTLTYYPTSYYLPCLYSIQYSLTLFVRYVQIPWGITSTVIPTLMRILAHGNMRCPGLQDCKLEMDNLANGINLAIRCDWCNLTEVLVYREIGTISIFVKVKPPKHQSRKLNLAQLL